MLFEKIHARRARLGFARRRSRPRALPTADGDSQAERATEALAKFCVVPRRRSAQPVIEVQRSQAAPTLRPVRPEQEQQRNRVRAARQRDVPPIGRRPVRHPFEHLAVKPIARDRGPKCRGGFSPVDSAAVGHGQGKPAPATLRQGGGEPAALGEGQVFLAKIRHERRGNFHATVRLEIVFQNGRKDARHGKA